MSAEKEASERNGVEGMTTSRAPLLKYCHRLFEPQDLSARSWMRIIQGLPDHFGRGDVRPIDPKQRQLLEAYLLSSKDSGI